METSESPQLIQQLLAKLPDFRKAYLEGGLAPEEFKEFGPLQYFCSMFVKGWDTLVENIRQRRRALLTTRSSLA